MLISNFVHFKNFQNDPKKFFRNFFHRSQGIFILLKFILRKFQEKRKKCYAAGGKTFQAAWSIIFDPVTKSISELKGTVSRAF
jgi:hypothetical protein